MTKSRRKFTASEKAAIVRRHLKGKEAISAIAEELSIQPTQIHQWVALALEQVERASVRERTGLGVEVAGIMRPTEGMRHSPVYVY